MTSVNDVQAMISDMYVNYNDFTYISLNASFMFTTHWCVNTSTLFQNIHIYLTTNVNY